MKRFWSLAAAAVAVVVCSTAAQAALTLSAGTHTFNSNGALFGGGVAVNNVARTISVDLDFLKAGGAIDIGFDVTSTDDTVDTHNYLVTVTSRNSITPSNTSLGFAMNGFDVLVVDPAGGPLAGLRNTPRPTSDKFAALPVVGNPLAGVGGYRFGGFLGGGGEIYNGQSAINTFTVRVAGDGAGLTPNGFSLRFTANPEPTTLILGSLVMAPAAFALRRRRKVQAQESVEAV